jgi:putative tryptophan/tyrosine transport system substrate-binding protein
MRRRDFITLLGGAAAWPVAAREQPKLPVIGFLGTASATGDAFRVAALRRGLEEGGYVEGRSITIEYRYAEDRYERLPILAADLVRRGVEVIVAAGGSSAFAAKAATSTIPIVFSTGADPVAVGLVASLSRPGRNATGMTTLEGELAAKRVEVLHELVPKAVKVGILSNPSNAITGSAGAMQDAGHRLGVETRVVLAGSDQELDDVFASFSGMGIEALATVADTFFNSRARQLAALSLRHGVPTVHEVQEFAAAGGLASYGTNLSEMYRAVGAYAARILKGEKPADLPVQQPTKFDLVINLHTAKLLGVDVPPSLLAIANEVLE